MADVPDHLVPTDGLTNSHIRFDSLFVDQANGSVRVVFGVYDEAKTRITELFVDVPIANYGNGTDGLIAEAHRRMTDILRQWLYVTDKIRQGYEAP